MNQSTLAILLLYNFIFILTTIVSTSANYREEWNLLTLIAQNYNTGLDTTDTDTVLNLTAKEHAFQFPAETIFPELMITNDAFFFIKLLPTSTAFTILTIRDPLDAIKLNIRAYEKRDQFNQFRLSILYNTELIGQNEYKNETEITVPFMYTVWTLGILFENQKLTIYTSCDDILNPYGYHQSSNRALINKKFFESGATLFLLNNGEVNGNKERFEGTVSEFVLTSKKNIEEFMCQKEISEGSGMYKELRKQKNIGNYLITERTSESSSTASTNINFFSNRLSKFQISLRSSKQTSRLTTKSFRTKWSFKIPKTTSQKMFLHTVPESTRISTKINTFSTTTKRKPIIFSSRLSSSKKFTTKSENLKDSNTRQISTATSKKLSITTKKPIKFENYTVSTKEKSASTTINSNTYKNFTIFNKLPAIIKNQIITSENSMATVAEESISTKDLTTISKKLSSITKVPTFSTKNSSTEQSTVTDKLLKNITESPILFKISKVEKPNTNTTIEYLQNTTSTERPTLTSTTTTTTNTATSTTTIQPKFLIATKYFDYNNTNVTSTTIINSTDHSITFKEIFTILSKSNITEKKLFKYNSTVSKGVKSDRETSTFNDSESSNCQANLRLNIPEKGNKGIQGSKGSKGEKGNTGTPGVNGTCLSSQCIRILPSKAAKGEKGDTGYCSVKSCKIDRSSDKGEKGNKGERGSKGESGDGLKLSELVQVILPEVKSTIDDFVSRNMMNMKGEPGSCSCPSEFNKEEGKIKTQTLILNDAKSLKSSSLTMPVGQMVFLIVENILLIKIDEVKNRWRVVKLESAETDWYFTTDTQNFQNLQQTAGQPMFNSAFKLMLIALPKPTAGDLRSDPFEPGAYSGSSYLCQKQAYNYGLGRAFYPLLNTDMFDFNYLLPEKFRYGVPVVNRRNEKIALSFADLLKPSVEMQANILDFRGDPIMSETNEPCVWIGDKPSLHEDKNPNEEGLCLNWMSQNSKNSAKVTFLKLNKPFLNPSQIKDKSCNTMCYILCMQIYPLMSEVRKR